MNLRIASEYIRFRISKDEFFQLQSHEPLTGVTRIAEIICLEYTLRVDTATHRFDEKLLDLATVQKPHAIQLKLTIFSKGMDQLKSDLGGKDGIREFLTFSNGDILTVGLEIDLHSEKGTVKS